MRSIILDTKYQTFLTDGEGNLKLDEKGRQIAIARDLISGDIYARVEEHPDKAELAKLQADPDVFHNSSDVPGFNGWWTRVPDTLVDHASETTTPLKPAAK